MPRFNAAPLLLDSTPPRLRARVKIRLVLEPDWSRMVYCSSPCPSNSTTSGILPELVTS